MAVEGSTETARGKVIRTEPTKHQRAAARRVAESKATIPHTYLAIDAVLDSEPSESQIAGAVVHATAMALREHPRLNGAYRDGGFESYGRVNIGVALGDGQDVVVPTIFDADQKQPDAIAAELDALTDRAGDLSSPELAGGTFTVSIRTKGRVRSAGPIVSQGQAGTVAFGAIVDRPVASGTDVAIAPVMTITLACDARIIGVGDGSAFLESLRGLLEESRPLG